MKIVFGGLKDLTACSWSDVLYHSTDGPLRRVGFSIECCAKRAQQEPADIFSLFPFT